MAYKELEDKEIFKNVIAAVIKSRNIKKKRFHDIMGYSVSTPYMVLNGTNNLSTEMIERILDNFPEVSPLYLSRGVGSPLIDGEASPTRKPGTVTLDDLMHLPARLDKIDAAQAKQTALLEEIKQLLTNNT